MARQLSTEGLVGRKTLEKLAKQRLREAHALFESEQYAGSVYLAGYAVECYLKAAICKALDWEEFRATFAVHDLEGLLLHSGLGRKIESNVKVRDSFTRVKEVWIVHGKQSIRYKDPDLFTRKGAEDFLELIADEKRGVVPWVKEQI